MLENGIGIGHKPLRVLLLMIFLLRAYLQYPTQYPPVHCAGFSSTPPSQIIRDSPFDLRSREAGVFIKGQNTSPLGDNRHALAGVVFNEEVFCRAGRSDPQHQ